MCILCTIAVLLNLLPIKSTSNTAICSSYRVRTFIATIINGCTIREYFSAVLYIKVRVHTYYDYYNYAYLLYIMYLYYVHIYIFTDLPLPINLRNVSTICVTFFNISWNAFNGITCGDVSYEVLVYQSSIGQSMEEITRINDTFYSITGLNNNDPDVMVTVTASNRAGQGNMSITVRLPPSLGKCYLRICISLSTIVALVIKYAT